MMRLSTGKECVDSLRNGQPFKDEEIPFIPEDIFNTLKENDPERFAEIVQ
ncbi:MAG: hypothetical protein IJF17_07820 [Thermoguttaceae bacterium]|nr:hypothetical protein [Thermoguttaceae bacterium]